MFAFQLIPTILSAPVALLLSLLLQVVLFSIGKKEKEIAPMSLSLH